MQKLKYKSCNVNHLESKDCINSKMINKNTKYKLDNEVIPEKNDSRVCKKPEKLKKSVSSLQYKRVLDNETLFKLKNDAFVASAEEQRMADDLKLLNEEKLKNERKIRNEKLQKYDNLKKAKGPKLTQVSNRIIIAFGYIISYN